MDANAVTATVIFLLCVPSFLIGYSLGVIDIQRYHQEVHIKKLGYHIVITRQDLQMGGRKINNALDRKFGLIHDEQKDG